MTTKRKKIPIVIGSKHGNLTVLESVTRHNGKQNTRYVRCLCDCGEETTPLWNNVSKGLTSSCGCLRREAAVKRLGTTHKPVKIGLTFHGMAIESIVEGSVPLNVRVRCHCGSLTDRVYSVFKQGTLRSCGCLPFHFLIHGESRGPVNKIKQNTALYACWCKIKQYKGEYPDSWKDYQFFRNLFNGQNLKHGETLSRLNRHLPWSADNVHKKATNSKRTNP